MRWTMSFLLALMMLTGLVAPVSAGGAPGPAHAPLPVVNGSGTVGPLLAQDAATTPEQELIERYAPIIGLKNQDEACDEDGEPFYPVSVDVVLGKDDVVLKRKTGTSSSSDEVVMAAPGASDLYAKDKTYYLDLPGNPRHAGCDYEQWFDANKDGYDPTAYAHIVATGTNQLAIQYWFFYVYNNFNNTHESDWEMMQVLFDVGTVEAALQTDPVAVAVAQHGGGETADWDDDKLQRDGTHPIVYSAAGSHATQYGNAVYLGWGENGTGFGCDITTSPSTLVPVNVELLPATEPDPNGEFSWLNFAGRWGERQEGEFNGPTGPSTKRAWKSPFVWQEGLRDSSIEVPLAETFGPAPTDVFCTLSAAGSNLFRVIGDNPPVFITSIIAILAAIVSLIRYAWPTLRAAAGVYRKRWRTFLAIGAWLVPVSILFNGFQYLVWEYPPGSNVIALIGTSPGTYYALALLTLIAQHLASLIVIGPMMIEVYDGLEQGRNPTFREAWRAMLRKLPALAKAVSLVALIVVVLSTTVIGVPIAIWLGVRWLFTAQATMLDEVGVQESLGHSSVSVRGRWWRVALVGPSLLVLAAAPGVLVGLVLLVFGSATVQATNVVSSLIYVVTVPLSILGLTVLYRHRDLTPPMLPLIRKLVSRFRSASEGGSTAAAP